LICSEVRRLRGAESQETSESGRGSPGNNRGMRGPDLMDIIMLSSLGRSGGGFGSRGGGSFGGGGFGGGGGGGGFGGGGASGSW